MGVKMVCREMVKPSSPTPDHLKTHKLSSLEQCKPPAYYPTLLFYQNLINPSSLQSQEEEEESSRRSQLLKLSLSRILTSFYPFAGILDTDVFSVLCDDHGVPFILANANFPLAAFLQRPDLRRLSEFAPEEVRGLNGASCPHVALVQVTRFSCGGFVISASVNHLVADAASVSFFLRSWATLYRDHDQSDQYLKQPPIFNASSLFPPAKNVPEEVRRVFGLDQFKKQVKVGARRLVFGPAAIRALKEKLASLSVPNPTRTEVVSAHLSKCIISVLEARSGCKKGAAAVSQAVNLRRRAEPPFPEELIGYLIWQAVVPWVGEADDLVKEIREATAKIDVERMRSAEKLFEERRNDYSGAAPGSELIAFTSRCDIGLYEVDFGWGKPIWVTYAGVPPIGAGIMFINLVFLMDTRSGDGVEATLFLDEGDLALLEQCQDLLAYAAFDQSPLLHQDW